MTPKKPPSIPPAHSTVEFGCPDWLVKELDWWAKAEGYDRQEMLREMVRLYIRAKTTGAIPVVRRVTDSGPRYAAMMEGKA